MPPTIHCIRHGQGLHNVGTGHYDLPDPKLTPLGEAQCLALRDSHFSDQSRISLITASPMSRALQSAFLTFAPSLAIDHKSKTILAIPDAQETSDSPCDIGSDPDSLKTICDESGWPVDLSLVKNGWNDKDPTRRYSPSSSSIEARARDVRLFLRQQARDLMLSGDENPQIVLVAHGGFLHYFSGDWEGAEKFPGTGWINCETRSYTFEQGVVEDDGDIDAFVVETEESRLRRGLDHPMFPRDKQCGFYEQAMQAWEDQGLQNHSKVGQSSTNVEIIEGRGCPTSTTRTIQVEA